MNKKCDINDFRETAEIRNKLKKLGICSVVGPTGPRGLPGTNIKLPATDIKCQVKANTLCEVFGTALLTLNEGDELTLFINSKQTTELILNGTTSAKLSTMKID